MVSALVAFILARPFGLQSLFHRLTSAILGSHAQKCRKEAKGVGFMVVREASSSGTGDNGHDMCDAVRHYVDQTTGDERIAMAAQAAQSGCHLVEIIVANYNKHDPDMENSTIPAIPANVIPYLQKLLSLLSIARDYDGLIAFSNSAAFVKVIKDTLTVVLYGPLTQWGKTCKLSDRAHDLQIFLTDLVETARQKDVDLAAFLTLTRTHQQRLYYLFSEAYTRGGTLTDPFRHWCALGLAWMRTSSLDVTSTVSSPSSTTATTPPKLSVDVASLLSSVPSSASRAAIIKETDALVHWTKWTKIRWHIEMRRNILLQQGAVGLARRVDVDEAVRFVAAALGEDAGSAGSAGPPPAFSRGRRAKEKYQNKHFTRASSTKLALSDQFAQGWFADPAVLSVLDHDPGYHRPGPKRPSLIETHKHLLGRFVESIRPTLAQADEITLTRVKAGLNG